MMCVDHADSNPVVRSLIASPIIIVLALSALAGQPAHGQDTVLEGADAVQFARERGWLIRDASDTRTIELQCIVNGFPRYYITHNRNAADSVSTDECWPIGTNGLALSGAGVTVGIWDGGAVITDHSEFEGRATQMDDASAFDAHATHVSGTMIAAGIWPGNATYPAGLSQGMAWEASLDCYDWSDDEQEMADAAAAGLRVSNHSYGNITGWIYDDFGTGPYWFWLGDFRLSETEDFNFGFYDSQAAEWDQIAMQYPRYLFVKSAGNDRDEGPSPGTGHYFANWDTGYFEWSTVTRSLDGNDGYDSVAHVGVSKNGLTVGAVYDVIGGYAGPGSVGMSSFSCWGPTDDGRIKPDIVGNGIHLFSPIWKDDTYEYWNGLYSGTSMSSPNVTGSLGLLIEHWRETHPGAADMLAATLKGLVLHTADEAGLADGPDYEFGWGLMNTFEAANAITADVTKPLTISEQLLQNKEGVELRVIADDVGEELRATICWTDPPGTPVENSVDPPDKMLVNDLDLRIETYPAGTVYSPWVLDAAYPGTAATTGDNNTDNVEQVVIDASPGDSYVLRVTHKGSLFGYSQRFSLILTGARHDCNTNGIPDQDDISGGTSLDCNTNAIPDECDIASGASGDCNGNGVPDTCETDGDGDGVIDPCDPCPSHPDELPGACGCGVPDTDSDGDGSPNCVDGCPNDADKHNPGVCGCGESDVDSDGDGIPDCNDQCPNEEDVDSDGDGLMNCNELCPFDAAKTEPGVCGCGVAEIDGDGDGTPDCKDTCPSDSNKSAPGMCGCNHPETDTDGDGVPDCIDGTPDGAAEAVVITGPDVVTIGQSASYTAEVVFADGDRETVSDRVAWKVRDVIVHPSSTRTSTGDIISQSGMLTVGTNREYETTLAIRATFKDGPVDLLGVKMVEVVNPEEKEEEPELIAPIQPEEEVSGQQTPELADGVAQPASTTAQGGTPCAVGMIVPLASGLLLLGFVGVSRRRRSS